MTEDLGVQPLDGLMTKLGLSNHDLVAASTEQLTPLEIGGKSFYVRESQMIKLQLPLSIEQVRKRKKRFLSLTGLTHKMVQKGRKGRRLSPRIKTKILNALHAAVPDRKFALKDLFDY